MCQWNSTQDHADKGQEFQLMFTLNIRMGTKYDLSDFDHTVAWLLVPPF